eukprot:6307371-Pyramimonas_sp.AAC.1
MVAPHSQRFILPRALPLPGADLRFRKPGLMKVPHLPGILMRRVMRIGNMLLFLRARSDPPTISHLP